MRQVIVSLVLLGIVGCAVVGWKALSSPAPSAPQRASQAVLVEAVVVTRRPVSNRLDAVGTTRAHKAVDIRPLSGGRIVALLFQPGQVVRRGDALARLDDETQRATLKEAEAALVEANQAWDRARRLRATQAVAQVTLDEAAARQSAAQAGLDRARKALDERTVRAPFDGTVGFREVDVGARVSDGDLITTLDDLSVVEIAFAVPERHYGRLRLGQAVQATTPAFPDRVFVGQITQIDTRIGEVSRAFRVRASLPNPDHLLPAGLSVNVEIVGEARQALMVPEGAVMSEAGGGVVFVVEDGRAVRRSVRLGLRERDAVEVIEGLTEGETIVRQGVQRVRNGVPVRVNNPPPAPAS